MGTTMNTLEDLRTVLLKVITAAKTLDLEYALRDEIYAISDGLDEFKRGMPNRYGYIIRYIILLALVN